RRRGSVPAACSFRLAYERQTPSIQARARSRKRPQPLTRLILSRLLQLPVILAVIFIVTFTLAWAVPGNPLEAQSGRRPPPEVEAAMLRQYNLDSSWSFAWGYLKGVFVGTETHAPPYFGPSLQYRDQTVNDIISEGLPVSAALGASALAVALFIGLIAGVAGALRPGSPLDLASLGVALIGVSLPTFVTGSVLLVVFGGLLHWMPIGGWGKPI